MACDIYILQHHNILIIINIFIVLYMIHQYINLKSVVHIYNITKSFINSFLTLQTEEEFNFDYWIEKREDIESVGPLYIKGVAR